MQKQEIKEKLLELLTSKDTMSLQIDVKDLTDETSLINDIGLDSIQILELTVAIENKFKVSIGSEEINIDIFDRFGDLIDHLDTTIKSGPKE
ncbi:MAG: acyl carrier protein [bacterium]|nr:acyl carrier protein [bacterium]